MSERKHIIDGSLYAGQNDGLIYTRKCGWIDLGHANPWGENGEGIGNLWVRLNTGNYTLSSQYYELTYKQVMKYKNTLVVGRERKYAIRGGLTTEELKSVTLSILFDVSHDFEQMQGNWLFSLKTDSSYSAEDLLSNLIGLYRVVEPNRDHIALCEPVSMKEALYVWDTYGAVGTHKNTSSGPYLYPTHPNSNESFGCVKIPWFLDSIKPAIKGKLFKEIDQGFVWWIQ